MLAGAVEGTTTRYGLDLFPPAVRTCIAEAAGTPLPVLITGETGTGKTTAARAIHRLSRRSTGPFIQVDCTTIAPTLIEAELFGNERGAYTDAKTQRTGLIQLAHGGTLFLDEIADLPYASQPKLLRVVDSGEFRRVGSGVTKQVDVRTICATHRDLLAMIPTRQFREDLFWRLYGFHLALPPTRDLGEHLPFVVQRLVQKSMDRLFEPGQHSPLVLNEFLDGLAVLRLPGNIRELEHIVTMALFASRGQSLRAKHIPRTVVQIEAALSNGHVAANARRAYVRPRNADQERNRILDVLRWTNGNKTAAASALGMSRTVLYERLRSHGILKHEYSHKPVAQPRDNG